MATKMKPKVPHAYGLLKMLQRGSVVAGVAGIGVLSCISVVPAGHIGIWNTFGKVSDHYSKPGLVIRPPWTSIHRMSVQTQCKNITAHCPSKEGLSVDLNSSIFYRLNPEEAIRLYKEVGRKYDEILLEPKARSIVRKLTASHEVKDLYSDQRAGIEETMHHELVKELGPRGVIIESTPFQKIKLPEKLLASIEQKLQMEQENMRMDFVLAKEKKEAERKSLEAQGIAEFQKIVSKGIDNNLLKWKGIEATNNLAQSANAKVVVVGGKDGLPLIFNSEK